MQPFNNRLTRSLSLAVLGAVLLAGAAACGDDDNPTATPGVSPTTPAPGETTSPTPGETTTPAGPVGDPDLDPIAEAIDDGDIDGLIDLVHFTGIACVDKVEGAGGPPECPAGVPAATVVKVLPMSACEGYYVHEAALEDALTTLLGRGLDLYAAYGQTRPGTDTFPGGDKVVLYEESTSGVGRMVNVADGEIVSITEMCGSNPAHVIRASGITSFVLEPAA